MRHDLLEVQASIDWPFSRLVDFSNRLEAWLTASVRIEIRDVPPPATQNPIVAVETELLPLAFSVEAGAYINAIRSSLDILEMVLVRRHGLVIPEDKVSSHSSEAKKLLKSKAVACSCSICPWRTARSLRL